MFYNDTWLLRESTFAAIQFDNWSVDVSAPDTETLPENIIQIKSIALISLSIDHQTANWNYLLPLWQKVKVKK